MLRTQRGFTAPEIGAAHRASEWRTPQFRVSRHDGRRVASDWALVERAFPFVHGLSRTSISILLEGQGRFEENGAREWLSEGAIVASDQCRRGTEGYAGERTSVMVIEWDPAVLGARIPGAFDHQRLSARDFESVRAISAGLDGPDAEGAALDLVDLLRSLGLPIARMDRGDLENGSTEDERRLSIAINEQLSNLPAYPSVDDIASELGWSSRHVNRRFAELASAYGLTHTNWRAMLHEMRLVTAFRMLSVRGVTTELVARYTGFRSPNALCHAFAKAGLPSPGVLARAAQREVLDAWTAYSDRPEQSAAE